MGHPFEGISVAGKPIGDDNPRDYLDTLQLNPYPLTCPLTAAFEQLGDNGQPGGMVKDHKPVMPLPFYLYQEVCKWQKMQTKPEEDGILTG